MYVSKQHTKKSIRHTGNSVSISVTADSEWDRIWHQNIAFTHP